VSPRKGQPLKESPRVCRVMINFTLEEKEKLDYYCECNNIKLSELCRNETLKLVKKSDQTEQDKELKRLRNKAKKYSLVIAKGYRRYANTREMVLDNDGRKTTGYLITNKRNDIIAGADDNELYTMSFVELVDFFENYSGR
jgi:hypothetical protein